MKLYHGGMIAIEKPALKTPYARNHTSDFGDGFYTTTDLEQAIRWTQIRQIYYSSGNGIVSIYEIDDNLFHDPKLNCLIFKKADKKWLEFVMKNRQNKNYKHDYDIVAGPIANDRVYATLTLFENNFLNAVETIQRLKTFKFANQILFHTELSLQKLSYIGNEIVK
ncbi:MAG: DUF3990 domain-containing protein [Planctomycetaceae bacterium]|jgi:hypothetical protein|nr:DUF3990 domain-containing protein [Planctomycetaceae bacterium]